MCCSAWAVDADERAEYIALGHCSPYLIVTVSQVFFTPRIAFAS